MQRQEKNLNKENTGKRKLNLLIWEIGQGQASPTTVQEAELCLLANLLDNLMNTAFFSVS